MNIFRILLLFVVLITACVQEDASQDPNANREISAATLAPSPTLSEALQTGFVSDIDGGRPNSSGVVVTSSPAETVIVITNTPEPLPTVDLTAEALVTPDIGISPVNTEPDESGVCYASPQGFVFWTCSLSEQPGDFSGGEASMYIDYSGPAPIGLISHVAIVYATERDREILLRKEIEANAIALEWYLLHELDAGTDAVPSFVDGAAIQIIGDDANNMDALELPILVLPWDGVSAPSCNHLGQIQQLYSKGEIIGTGVLPLMQKYGCPIL